jgi:hypothetical protein
VQPLQARKNPLWLYSGADDSDRVSEDLPLKDLEKLVCGFTCLSKKSEVPSSFRVEPFSGVHALQAVSVFLRVLLQVFNCNWLFFGSVGFALLSRPFFLQDHQTLSSLPPLPEGGDVSERAIVIDNSQETFVRESEPVESDKSAGSSDKGSESVQASESSHSISPPPATSSNKRKR